MAEFTEAEERVIEASQRVFELRVEHFDLRDRMEAAQAAGDEAALLLKDEHPSFERTEELLREGVRRTGQNPDSQLAQVVESALEEARALIALSALVDDDSPVL